MAVVHVGLGANLGDAQAALLEALEALRRLPSTELLAVSPLYRSAPVDAAGPDYVNAVARLLTGLAPEALLAALQQIEAGQGRQRSYRNAPRCLDLDLLLYGDEHIDTPSLTVPHPRMHQRAFVLLPLADVSPDAVVPGQGSVQTLLPGVAGQRIERVNP